MDEDEPLTYAKAGVDIDASEAATAALVSQLTDDSDGYAGLVDIGDSYLALATDGVGTKLVVAEAMNDYSTVGIDCIGMNVNDLVAAGVRPVAFVDYLAVDDADDGVAAEIGEGLNAGAQSAGIELVGGETAVMPEVVDGLDLAGTCAGIAPKTAPFEAAAQPGDTLVGWNSSGIHSNGLTLARTAVTRDHEYTDACPFGAYDSIGAALLEPTRLYTDLLEPMQTHDVRGAAHITGGGWTNLTRLGDNRYVIDNPYPAQEVFTFIQQHGDISDEEMHRTFNMGTGFVAAVPQDNAERLAASSKGRIVGRVEEGGGVRIRDCTLSATHS